MTGRDIIYEWVPTAAQCRESYISLETYCKNAGIPWTNYLVILSQNVFNWASLVTSEHLFWSGSVQAAGTDVEERSYCLCRCLCQAVWLLCFHDGGRPVFDCVFSRECVMALLPLWFCVLGEICWALVYQLSLCKYLSSKCSLKRFEHKSFPVLNGHLFQRIIGMIAEICFKCSPSPLSSTW